MYIYKITNLINNKAYIGLKTQSVESSVDYYGSGKLIKQAIKKYGIDNFSKEILERDIIDRDVLNEREIYWIAEYGTYDNPNHYNLTEGGGGVKGLLPWNIGIPCTPQELAKRIGKKKTPEHIAKLKASRKKTMANRKYSGQFIVSGTRGKLWIHDPITMKTKFAIGDTLSELLNSGWILGRK